MNHRRIKSSILVVDFFWNADPGIWLESTLFTLEPDSVPVTDILEELVAFVLWVDHKIDPF